MTVALTLSKDDFTNSSTRNRQGIQSMRHRLSGFSLAQYGPKRPPIASTKRRCRVSVDAFVECIHAEGGGFDGGN